MLRVYEDVLNLILMQLKVYTWIYNMDRRQVDPIEGTALVTLHAMEVHRCKNITQLPT